MLSANMAQSFGHFVVRFAFPYPEDRRDVSRQAVFCLLRFLGIGLEALNHKTLNPKTLNSYALHFLKPNPKALNPKPNA